MTDQPILAVRDIPVRRGRTLKLDSIPLLAEIIISGTRVFGNNNVYGPLLDTGSLIP